MGTTVVDFIAKGPSEGAWSMVLVEEGPWSSSEVEINLHRLQERLYGCLDAALDGHLAKLYPESAGALVTIRLDGYDIPQAAVREFFERFRSSVLLVPDYAASLKDNEFVRGVAFQPSLEQLRR